MEHRAVTFPTRDEVLGIIEDALSLSEADQTEVVVMVMDGGLTRFANNQIHQNTADMNCHINIRVVIGKRIGGASANQWDRESLQTAVAKAIAIATVQDELPDFPGLPEPQPIPQVTAFAESTALASPALRGDLAGKIIHRAQSAGAIASGAVSTHHCMLAVGNSLGVRATFESTVAHIHTVINADDGFGYASQTAADVEEIDSEQVGERALQKAINSRKPIEIPPGNYTVVLEEEAVATLLMMLAYMGLGARAVQEGRSFMCERFGERIMSECVTIYDDALNTEGLPQPFDYEGVPKQKVVCIESGVAKAVVYDTYTAAREGKQSTGHALPQPNPWGPYPTNLFMSTGELTLEEMISTTERGLLITRFHYVNPVHPKRTVITGMTRDGTFLIEDGRVTHGVRNLRFTQSILDALSCVDAISRTRKLCDSTVAPAVKVNQFAFTGVTEF